MCELVNPIILKHAPGRCCPDYECLYTGWNQKTCRYCGADCSKCMHQENEKKRRLMSEEVKQFLLCGFSKSDQIKLEMQLNENEKKGFQRFFIFSRDQCFNIEFGQIVENRTLTLYEKMHNEDYKKLFPAEFKRISEQIK